MVVWWLASTLLLVVAIVGVETLLVALGPVIGIRYFSLQYWVILLVSAIGLITLSSMLASQFYSTRMGWSVELPLSQDGFVDAVILSQGLLVLGVVMFCFFIRGRGRFS